VATFEARRTPPAEAPRRFSSLWSRGRRLADHALFSRASAASGLG
jgi:hypothetical protein